jgi:hypothetical protein
MEPKPIRTCAPRAASPLIWLAAILIAAGTAGPAAAVAPPSIAKAFFRASIAVNGIATMTVTITNPNSTDSEFGVAFFDSLPANLVVATPNNLINTCSGTATANSGTSQVSLSGGTIAPAGSCTVSVNVTSSIVGTYLNFAGPVSSTNGGTGNTASATLHVKPFTAPSGAHDFDANGISDIAWRQNSGSVGLWLMTGTQNGTQIIQIGSFGVVPMNWQLVGQRDFNGDAKHDFLWRDVNTGTVGIWLLNGLQAPQAGIVQGTPPLNWTVVGTGDFNNDRRADILWRDINTGAVGMWLMNGLQVVQAGIVQGAAPLNWTIAGTGDFNGDGKADILWRDSNSGAVGIWLMNGLQLLQAGIVQGTPPLNWTIAGTGDFNGDGFTDILWRDSNTGTVGIWLMNGAGILQSGTLGVVPSNWVIVATGDYDGDGFTDILWRDSNSGTVAVWFMNGLQVTSTANLGVATLDWTVQGLNAD